jgi:hypothetical protein
VNPSFLYKNCACKYTSVEWRKNAFTNKIMQVLTVFVCLLIWVTLGAFKKNLLQLQWWPRKFYYQNITAKWHRTKHVKSKMKPISLGKWIMKYETNKSDAYFYARIVLMHLSSSINIFRSPYLIQSFTLQCLGF